MGVGVVWSGSESGVEWEWCGLGVRVVWSGSESESGVEWE